MHPSGVRPNHPRKLLIPLILLLVALGLGGCSAMRIAYQGADVAVRHYADDFLDLDGERLAAWQPQLDQALARHRSEELPYLARFFEDARAGVSQGLDRTRVECLEDQFLTLYRRQARWAVDLAAPLLAAAGPSQARRLEARFREDWAEAADLSAAAVARRERKRAQRYGDAASWWIGGLSEAQTDLVRRTTAAMPDTAAAWAAYRRSRQEGLLRLVQRGADTSEIQSYLSDWLVEHRDLPPSLGEAVVSLREGVTRLLLGLDQSLSAAQRAQFQRRLRGLRDDFLALQPTAVLAGAQCP